MVFKKVLRIAQARWLPRGIGHLLSPEGKKKKPKLQIDNHIWHRASEREQWNSTDKSWKTTEAWQERKVRHSALLGLAGCWERLNIVEKATWNPQLSMFSPQTTLILAMGEFFYTHRPWGCHGWQPGDPMWTLLYRESLHWVICSHPQELSSCSTL